MSVVLLSAISRFESPSGICRGAASTANALAELADVDAVYLAIGHWQVGYYTQQFKLTSSKIHVIGIDVPNTSVRRNGWLLGTLPRLAKQLRADFVLLGYPMPVLKPLFPAACQLAVIIHDLYPFSNPANFGYPNVYANQLFMRLCVANVDQFVFVSEQTRQAFYTYFPTQKQPGRVIHWYADLDHARQQRPANVPARQRYVLMIAQHRKNKNIDLLLNAFDSLRRTRQLAPDTYLYVVGSDGPETPALQALVEQRSLGTSVHFLHALTDPELAYLYAHCDLVVCPSSVEGFGYTLIESALFGKRVVCSDIPIFREVGGEHCVYFSLTGNATEHLAKAIEQAGTLPPLTSNESRPASLERMKAAYRVALQLPSERKANDQTAEIG